MQKKISRSLIIFFVVVVIVGFGIGAFQIHSYFQKQEFAHFPQGFAWKFADAGKDTVQNVPQVRILLISPQGKEFTAGTFPGTCFDVGTSTRWTIDINEPAAVVCWWAM